MPISYHYIIGIKALLVSAFVRMLKWDLVNEAPTTVQPDKLSWTEGHEEELKHYEIKRKRYIPGSANLRLEYELKQESVPNESTEVIPRRDQRAVEIAARSGRKLRPLTKQSKF